MAIKRSVEVQVNVNSKGVDSSLKQTQEKFGSFFKSIGKLAGAFAIGDLLADGIRRVGRAAIDSVKDIIEFDQQLKQVGKTTGLTNDQLTSLGKGFIQLSKEIPVTTDALNDIAAIAGQLGINTEKAVAEFSKSVAKIGVALDLSAESAAENFAKIANAAGINLRETPELINNIASSVNELSNTGASSARDIVEAMRRIGNAGAPLGVTVDQLAALSSAVIEAGIDAETTGTSLRNTFIFATTNVDKFAKVLGVSMSEAQRMISEDAVGAVKLFIKQLGNADNAAQAASIGAEIFGTRSGQAIQALSNNFGRLEERLETSRKAFLENISIQKEFETQAEGAAQQLQLLQNNVKAIVQEFLLSLLPTIKNVIVGLTDFIRILGDKGPLAAFADAIGLTRNELAAFIEVIIKVATTIALMKFGPTMLLQFKKISLGALTAGKSALLMGRNFKLAAITANLGLKTLRVGIKLTKIAISFGVLLIIDFLIEKIIEFIDASGGFVGALKRMASFAIKVGKTIKDAIVSALISVLETVKDIPFLGDALNADTLLKALNKAGDKALDKQEEITRESEEIQKDSTRRAAEDYLNQEKIKNRKATTNFLNENEKRLLKALNIEEDNANKQLLMFAKKEAEKLGITEDMLDQERINKIKSEEQIQDQLFDLKVKSAEREANMQMRLAKKTQELIKNEVEKNPIDFFSGGGGFDKINATGGGSLAGAAGLGNIIGTVGKGESGAEDLIGSGIEMGLNAILPGLGAALAPIVDMLMLPTDELREQIQAFAEAIPDVIVRIIENIPVLIEELINAVPTLVQKLIDTLPEAVFALIEFLIFELPRILTTMQNALIEMIPGFINKLSQMAPIFIQRLIDGIPQIIDNFITSFISKAPFIAIKVAVALIKQMPNIAMRFSIALIKQAPRIISSIASGVGKAIKDILGSITNPFESIGGIFGFAQGGVVPSGFPNDSYPALLTSGERILSPSQSKAFDEGRLQPGPNPNPPKIMNKNDSSRGQSTIQNISISINGSEASNPNDLANMIIDKLRTESARGRKILSDKGIDNNG